MAIAPSPADQLSPADPQRLPEQEDTELLLDRLARWLADVAEEAA